MPCCLGGRPVEELDTETPSAQDASATPAKPHHQSRCPSHVETPSSGALAAAEPAGIPSRWVRRRPTQGHDTATDLPVPPRPPLRPRPWVHHRQPSRPLDPGKTATGSPAHSRPPQSPSPASAPARPSPPAPAPTLPAFQRRAHPRAKRLSPGQAPCRARRRTTAAGSFLWRGGEPSLAGQPRPLFSAVTLADYFNG